MKLNEINGTALAWQTLSTLKKNPKLAYRLLKYEKKVAAEMEAIHKAKEAIIYEAAGVPPPTPPDVLIVSIPPTLEEGEGKDKKVVENPQYRMFVDKFNEFLEGQSDLGWIGITMDDLIEGLGASETNALSERDIEMLEPFFKEPAKADLTVVK